MIVKTALWMIMTCCLFSIALGQIPIPQIRKADYDIQKFNIVHIELKSTNKIIQHVPIGSIQIVDARPDTQAIGLAQNYDQAPYFISSRHDFSTDVEKFVNDYIVYDKSDSLSAVMVFKKFWVSGIMDKEDNQRLNDLSRGTVSQRVTNLQARIEFYLKAGPDYYILYRFDTTLVNDRWASQDAPELVEETLKASLYKLIEMSPRLHDMIAGKKKFSWDEIEEHNRKKFDLPILHDSVLVAGVYYSFEDFKNNNPPQKTFELGKDKLTSVIYIRQQDGKLATVNDAWGYCDGRNLYILSLSNYFRLQRRANSFYIYGAKKYTHKNVINIPGTGLVTSAFTGSTGKFSNPVEYGSEGFNLKFRPFELDWDDGELR
jgi:hypothetical protein